ncbi:MAG: phosphatidylglycerophosphatase A [Pseudomonadota bacterium]|nr:phosphatidylglycerophosphatase A [Pseudomonadota bacterium]
MNQLTQGELLDRFKSDPLLWLACGFGSGLLPKAPGTFGTIIGILFWLLLPHDFILQVGFGLAFFFFGIWVCDLSAKRLGTHDHQAIVWDEIVGVYITLIFIPSEPLWVLIAFLLFRFFDIWKPWPIRGIDSSIQNGLGIMLDDVIAAFYSIVILIFLQSLIP